MMRQIYRISLLTCTMGAVLSNCPAAGQQRPAAGQPPRIRLAETASSPQSIERLPEPGPACQQTLVQLITQAQTVSPVVATAQARLEAAGGEALQASLGPNPRLGYVAEEIGNGGTAGLYSAYVQQRQVRGNKIPLRHGVAEQEYWARTVDLQSALSRVEIDVRRTFYRTLVARRRVDILRELVRMAEVTADAIGKLVQAEEMAKTAHLQAQLAVTNRRTQLITADRQYAAGRRSLAAWMNVAEQNLPDLDCGGFDQLPNYQWDLLSEQAANSLRTHRQQNVVAKAANQLALEQARQIVDVTWQVGVIFDDATHDVSTGVQVTHPLQLFDRNQGNIQQAHAELTAAHSENAAIVQDTVINLAGAYREFDAQRQRASVIAADLLPTALEGLQLTQLALEAGEIGYLEALVSQLSYAQANQQYLDAVDAAWQAAGDLELQFVIPR